MTEDAYIRALYERLLTAWNERDATAFAGCFEDAGGMVGFDGSQIDSRSAIGRHLRPLFADHPTPRYVAKVRAVRVVDPDVAILRGVAGMVPPGAEALEPKLNTIHSLVAVRRGDEWWAAFFQSTPAAWHGRPTDVTALTDELTAVLRSGATVAP